MKATDRQQRSVRYLGWLLPAVFMSCSSSYQAPIDDRSTRLEREAPIIVVDGQTMPSAPRAATTSAPASTTPSAPVGASDTVVRPVAVGTGITRSVTRSSIPPAESAPVSAAPAVTPPTSAAVQQSAPGTASVAAPTVSTAAPTSGQSTPAGAGGVHIVSQGDTLYSIAFAHNLDVRSLALANNLNPPYTIFPGQRLSLSAAGVTEAAISAVPRIPAAPAGESAPASGQRPQASVEARRTGSVATRSVDGVNWQWPADGRLLSTFSEAGPARGIDIAGNQGQPVYAAADGDVVYAGRGIQGAGNLVILRHSARHLSAYMYNSSMLVSEGDSVRAGDKIAEVGTGPNGRELLHFEVRVDGKPVDPVRYLPNR